MEQDEGLESNKSALLYSVTRVCQIQIIVLPRGRNSVNGRFFGSSSVSKKYPLPL